MFTGLIEEIGTVQHVWHEARAAKLAIEAKETLADVAVGDSIAVDGACLTVTLIERALFEVDLSDETLARTTLGGLRRADPVNLERPCRPADRLGGHVVTGHVDGVATILQVQEGGGMWWFSFSYPEALRRLLVVKGSLAVDGISLTIAGLTDRAFDVAVIPHTYRHTTLGGKRVGQRVNLETDLFGKYVIRYLEGLGLASRETLLSEASLREPRLI